MNPNRPQKPSEIDPKTGPESNVVFLPMFYQFGAPQTSNNTNKPKENSCFSRVCLFRIDQDVDQKTFKNDTQHQPKFDQQIDQKNKHFLDRCVIDFGSVLGANL